MERRRPGVSPARRLVINLTMTVIRFVSRASAGYALASAGDWRVFDRMMRHNASLAAATPVSWIRPCGCVARHGEEAQAASRAKLAGCMGNANDDAAVPAVRNGQLLAARLPAPRSSRDARQLAAGVAGTGCDLRRASLPLRACGKPDQADHGQHQDNVFHTPTRFQEPGIARNSNSECWIFVQRSAGSVTGPRDS